MKRRTVRARRGDAVAWRALLVAFADIVLGLADGLRFGGGSLIRGSLLWWLSRRRLFGRGLVNLRFGSLGDRSLGDRSLGDWSFGYARGSTLF